MNVPNNSNGVASGLAAGIDGEVEDVELKVDERNSSLHPEAERRHAVTHVSGFHLSSGSTTCCGRGFSDSDRVDNRTSPDVTEVFSSPRGSGPKHANSATSYDGFGRDGHSTMRHAYPVHTLERNEELLCGAETRNPGSAPKGALPWRHLQFHALARNCES